MDRTLQPPILPMEQIVIPEPEHLLMPNGVQLHYLNIGNEDVVRVDVIVRSGKWDAARSLETDFTGLMLKEGAANLNSAQIAEKLDYYGAWFQTYTTQQCSYLTLYSLNKFFDETLVVLEAMVKEPSFPEKEFDILRQNRKSRFSVDMDKVQYLAAKEFIRVLFGKNHPYGRSVGKEDFDTLSVSDTVGYYTNHYHSGNIEIAAFGKITGKMLTQIEHCFGKTAWGKQSPKTKQSSIIQPAKEKRKLIVKPGAVQSAVCVGKQIITRDHPDFHALSVLNTIFGGYFGSRLMSNIREDKGYTYGIYSSVTSHLHAGYLNILTQTGHEQVESVIKEIFMEMDKLAETLVPENELQIVRNYMLGELARKFDNPFAVADIYLSLSEFGLERDFYEKRIDRIKNITSEDIRELARRYFTKEDFYEVIAGNG
ncbi:MAG: insulinase family protein [Candidatus Azobacteroides sp.]|nr:insulinase family protein [Candidatus Azobacteroides sp.]